MPRPLFEDPYAAQAIDLLRDPARARAEAVRQIGDAQARAATIAGNAQANAQQQSGNAWAGAGQQIAQTVGNIPNDIIRAQQQSQQAALQKLQIQNETTRLGMQQQEFQHKSELAAAQKQIGQMMSSPDVFDENGLLNAKSLAAKMNARAASYNGPSEPPDMAKIYALIDPINSDISKAQESQRVAAEHKTNALARIASTALTLGKESGNYFQQAQVGIAAGLRSGLITQDQANQMLMPMIENRADIPNMLKGVAARSTLAPIKLGEKDRLLDPLDPTKTLVGAQEDPGKGDYTINGQRFHANGQPVGAVVPKQETPRLPSFEAKQVLLDGKPSIVRFDPATGAHTLPSGEDVSARVKPIPPASTIVNAGQASEAKDVADAIMRGEQPPDMRSLYRMAGPIKAELARSGYNLTNATLDWEATKKHVLALNSAQQLKLNQSVNALPELLDSVDALASQWKGGQFPVLNKANLIAAKNGIYGDDVASVARKLDQQIADVNSDLGAVYMGGNSPTDHALKLASTALSGEWSEKVLHEMVAQARSNVTIRQNSMRNTGVAGASTDNQYAPKAATPQPVPNWGRDANGNPVRLK